MTAEELKEFEHRLTELEQRAKSNTHRLDEHEEAIKENSNLISAIKELAVETKLENKDGDKWEKFKWLIVAGLVTIVLGYLAVTLGLK